MESETILRLAANRLRWFFAGDSALAAVGNLPASNRSLLDLRMVEGETEMIADYSAFLASKRLTVQPTGIKTIGGINENLFPFQRDVVTWALKRGRAALFEDCGLGKTFQELEWSRNVIASGGVEKSLTVAPLAVSRQIVSEAEKFGYSVTLCESDGDVRPGINITNYEKLQKFDCGRFGGVVLDESSILKSQDGATRNMILECFGRAQFRLAGTATPSPNDFMELGNHAEFLGVMTRSQMLSTFFVHDGGDTAKWRIKGHAEDEFWKWVCSWAVNIRRPSDIGYNDGDFVLPPLTVSEISVESEQVTDGMLFAMPASTLKERRDARRGSLNERVEAAARIANASGDQFIIWCDLNVESKDLTNAIDGGIEITGSDSDGKKIVAADGFLSGDNRCLICKPSMFGHGLNWQHCHNEIFVGLSDSFEQYYQAVRRCWRFGQKHPVNVWIITSKLEGAVVANIKRKEADANRMAEQMVKHMAKISQAEIKGLQRETVTYNPTKRMTLPKWL